MAPPHEQIDPNILKDFTGTTLDAMLPWLEDSANLEIKADSNHIFTRREHKQRVKQIIERLMSLDRSYTHLRSVRVPRMPDYPVR